MKNGVVINGVFYQVHYSEDNGPCIGCYLYWYCNSNTEGCAPCEVFKIHGKFIYFDTQNEE